MEESKESTNSHEEDERFLSRLYRSKEEFVKEYQRFYYGKAKSKDLYFRILTELQQAILKCNIDKFKRFVDLIDYIASIENPATLETFRYDRDNPIKRANFVILACKYDKIKILEYVFSNSSVLFGLSRDIGKDASTPGDKDEAGNDAFYYAIRSGNTELLDTLITQWPNDYFTTRPEELDEVLSKALEELKFKNVSLSDDMEIFVENKLINLRFFSNTSRFVLSAKDCLDNIRERVNFVLENIALLKTEYSSERKVDERFLFVARFIAQNVHVLKRHLRSTYDSLPWEEIEFCLVAFVSSYLKQQEINLFYRTILTKDKLLLHLEIFAKKLETCKSVIETTSISKLAELPKLKREEVIVKIVNDNPQFDGLYGDYQQIRDIYALERINSYIKLSLSIDPKEREGQLIITRALQVIGEYLKNTLESPNLSPTTSEFILLSLPKNTRKIIIELRNSLSHVYSLSKRTEIEENASVDFFIGVQNDIRRIDNVITEILFNNKIKIIRVLLNEISTKGLEEIRTVADVMKNVQIDNLMSNKSILPEHEKLKDLIRKWNAAIPNQTEYEMSQFERINQIVNFTGPKSTDVGTNYGLAFKVLQGLSAYLVDDTLDQKSAQSIKTEAKKAFDCIISKIESHNLRDLLYCSVNICDSVTSRIQGDRRDELNRLHFDIYSIAQIGMSDVDMKWIDKLREKLCNSSSTSSSKQKAAFNLTDDQCNKQLTLKLSELKIILTKNVSSGEIVENLPSYCRNKNLVAVVEMLVLDIMSILGRSGKYLENNLLFLDDNTPLLTGKCLRNHLAHGNTLLDVLLSDPSTAVILNAEKLISENIITSKKKFGKLVKDDPSKLKEKYDQTLLTIANQEKMFSALDNGNLEELKSCLQKGADINARSINSWTSLHFAARGLNLDIVKFILDLGFNANVKDCNGKSPLHIAAAHGRTNIVKFFIEELALPVDDVDKNNNTPLHIAAKIGNEDIVEMLLKKNADTNIMSAISGYSPLHYSVQNNHIPVFKILLQKEGNVDVNEADGGSTSLHLAAEYGCTEIVEILLKKGANVNAKQDKGRTPLHQAVMNGHSEIVDILILHGADVNFAILDGHTALLLAAEFGHVKVVETLLKHGAKVNVVDKIDKRSALHHAARNGSEEIVEMLLKNQANVNLATPTGLTPLHMTVANGHLKIAVSLLKHGSNIRAKNNTKCTSLHLAAQAGHKEIVQLLIKSRAEVDAKIDDGSTPLHVAAHEGHKEVVDLLLKNKARIESTDIEGDTPIFVAARKGHVDVVDLLRRNKANMNIKTNDGTTLLHIAAVSRQFNVAAYLIKNGFNVYVKDNDGVTPLHAATMGGQLEIVNLLLENGAKVDATSRIPGTNMDATTPLHMCVQVSSKEIAQSLLAHGADPNAKSGSLTPFSFAMRNNRKDIVEVLLANGAIIQPMAILAAIEAGFKGIIEILPKKLSCINWKNAIGVTFLHGAVKNGNIDMVNAFINRGANVNALGLENTTPLHLAALLGYDEIAEILISNGAHVDSSDAQGTPLHGACARGHDAVVDILLSHGADINVKGSNGRTPVELAVSYGNVPALKAILRHRKVSLSHSLILLFLAVESRQAEMVKFLAEQGCSLHVISACGLKPIHVAARDGYTDIVKALLDARQNFDLPESNLLTSVLGSVSINDPDTNGLTVLHYAVLENHTDLIKFLLTQGADPNVQDAHGISPMHMAVQFGLRDVVEALLEHGAVYNDKNCFSQTPFEMAKDKDSILLDNNTETPEMASKKEVILSLLAATEQLFEAVKRNSISDVENCIKARAFVNAKNASTESTVLHYAAWKGHHLAIDILLRNKANPNVVCNKGFTPSHYAAKFSHLESIKALMCHGAVYNPVSYSGKTPSDFAKNEAITDLFKVIGESFEKIKNGDAQVIDDLKKIRDAEILKAVLNARNREKKTLTSAAARIDESLFKQLKEISQSDLYEQMDKACNLLNYEIYEEGFYELNKLYEKRKMILGADDPGCLEIQKNIATGLYKQGNYQKSFNLNKEILIKQEELFGSDSKEVLDTKSSMATLLSIMGKDQEARSMYEEVYPKQCEILGPKHKDTLTTRFHMAEAYIKQKKWEEALSIYRTVYEAMKETLGSDDPCTIAALNNIGIVLSNQGKKEEALKIYQEVYEMKEAVLGPDHIDTLKSLQNIACIRVYQKKYQEALKIHQEVLNIEEAILPPNHPEILHTQYCIGSLYFDQGKYVSALKIFKECIEHKKALFGPSDRSVIDMLDKIKLINFKTKWEGRSPSEMLQCLQKDINVASSKGDVQKVRSLLQDGADVNDKDIDGRSPLHYAVSTGHLDVVNILLENGADVTQASNKGNTPLHTATSKGLKEIVEILLKNVSRDQSSDFVNAKTTSGGTSSLHVAAKSGFLEVVKCLLNHGAVYNIVNKEGKTPIDLAKDQKILALLKLIEDLFEDVKKGNVKVTTKLKMLKPDEFFLVMNARNNQGHGLLQVAIVNKRKDIASFLLQMLKKPGQ